LATILPGLISSACCKYVVGVRLQATVSLNGHGLTTHLGGYSLIGPATTPTTGGIASALVRVEGPGTLVASIGR
jgi:hypothetical protein